MEEEVEELRMLNEKEKRLNIILIVQGVLILFLLIIVIVKAAPGGAMSNTKNKVDEFRSRNND